MNFLSNDGFKKFAAVIFVFRIAADASFGEPAATPVTVQIGPFANYGAVNPNYNGQTLTNGKAYSMTAKPKSGFTFTGWAFTDASGSHTNSKAKLTFTNGVSFTAYFADTQKPSLTIQTPPNSTALTNPAIYVTGTAKDNDAVANVFCSLNGGDWQLASTGNGWNNWWTNVTLIPNTNTLRAFAMDRSGNCSKTNLLRMTYSAAPVNLNNMTITVVSNGDEIYSASFDNNTFTDGTGAGNYTYKKTGPVTGKVSLKYTAPPGALGSDTAMLLFKSGTAGSFTNAEGFSGNFTLMTASNSALPYLTGADLLLTDTNDIQTLLSFLTPPSIVDNGHLFNVLNPLVIWLSAAYPGNLADRVSVSFTHLQLLNGSWVAVSPKTFLGTVIATGNISGTNTVTVLFDSSGFVSKTDEYAPSTANNSLNILTYYFSEIPGTNGTGTFIYTNLSPTGSLLQLTQAGANIYYILTFTGQSSTNSTDSGNFYAETYASDGSFQTNDTGSFTIAAPPSFINQPKPLTVTNGGDASFSITVSGSQPLSYQWQFNGTNLNDAGNISGSTTTNLTISPATTNDAGSYQVVVTNLFGSVTCSQATLTVGVPPQIILPWPQPNTVSVTAGTTTNFYVTATGTAPLFYRWQLENTNLVNNSTFSGSTTTNLTLTSVTTNNVGNYTVIVTNSFGSSISPIVNLKVQ